MVPLVSMLLGLFVKNGRGDLCHDLLSLPITCFLEDTKPGKS